MLWTTRLVLVQQQPKRSFGLIKLPQPCQGRVAAVYLRGAHLHGAAQEDLYHGVSKRRQTHGVPADGGARG